MSLFLFNHSEINLNLENVIGVEDLADHPPTSHLITKETEAQREFARNRGKENKRRGKKNMQDLQDVLIQKKLFIVYLKFKFSWEFCILSGTICPVIFFFT